MKFSAQNTTRIYKQEMRHMRNLVGDIDKNLGANDFGKSLFVN